MARRAAASPASAVSRVISVMVVFKGVILDALFRFFTHESFGYPHQPRQGGGLPMQFWIIGLLLLRPGRFAGFYSRGVLQKVLDMGCFHGCGFLGPGFFLRPHAQVAAQGKILDCSEP